MGGAKLIIAKHVACLVAKLDAMYGMQVAAAFPLPKVCACVFEACDLLMCSNLFCYTAPKFPCKFYQNNNKII